MEVPLLDLAPQHEPWREAYRAAFARVFDSGRFILGGEVEQLEAQLAGLAGVPHALGLSSGTDALLVALMAAGIGPGDEVLVPAFTFFATAGCVHRLGATPVFCDVCPVCYNLDAADAARRITPRTRAIIPVHLFGQAAEMDAVNALADAHGLTVIEDAAQALGARYRGAPVGSFGHLAAASFFPTKNIGGFGDAGALLASDSGFFEAARVLRVHGMEPKYHHRVVGGNFRIDALQAALLNVKLPHIPDFNHQRRGNAARYADKLGALPGVALLSEENCRCGRDAPAPREARLLLPVAYAHNEHIWNQYTVRVPGPGRRDALKAHLQAAGVGCEVYYPVALHRQECFAKLPQAGESIPAAEQLAREVLSLPVYPGLSEAQQDWVVAQIASFLEAT